MIPAPGSLSTSVFNTGRFYYCCLKEQVDVYRDLHKAQFFLNTIKQAYDTPEKRGYLKALLTVEQWEDLKRLVEIVKSGKNEEEFVWIKKADLEQTAKQKLVIKESKMAQWLMQNKQVLTKVLPITDASSLKPEENLDIFGRADLMLIANRIGFPIELKDETGTERLSGQIFKYIKGAICLIKLGFYDTVQGVVIAPSYTQEALNQLFQRRVLIIQMSAVGDSFELKRLA